MTLRMANGSVQQPVEIIKDMIVTTDKFTFPTNFVVMEMEECNEVPLILGRSFMKIGRMVINMDKGRVKLQMQNEVLLMALWNNLNQPQPQGTFFKITDREKGESSLAFPMTIKKKICQANGVKIALLGRKPNIFLYVLLFCVLFCLCKKISEDKKKTKKEKLENNKEQSVKKP